MAVRFRLPATRLERMAFAYSPLLEAVLSLHVLTGPKHHSLQHPWVRRMRSLPPDLKREIAALSFAYRGGLPEFVTPQPVDDYDRFEEELARVLALPADTLAFAFTRPLVDHGGDRDPARLEDPELRARVRRHAERIGGDGRVALLALDDPPRLARRFVRLLERYWEHAFAAEWDRLEPLLADSVSGAGRELASEGLYPFLRRLSTQLRVEPELEQFGIDLPHDHIVEVTHERPLVLVPSAFTWPHLHVNCDEPLPLAIVYPAPFVREHARPVIPPDELTRVLKALADPTRLRALKLIGEQPRTTQELAPLIGITEAGLSKHLRTLAAAGLVETRREGYYVVYRLAAPTLGAATEGLRAYLGGPRDGPAE